MDNGSNKPQVLKGFRDFLPEDAKKRAWLRARLSGIMEQWGFAPLETPTLEPLEIFTGAIGEDEKLFFKFKDQGDRNVALRYDQTVPTCRVIAQYQNTLTFPFKRYQIQSAFRAEKPQKGRYREFTQCDADIYGVKGPEADAETIALSLDIYRQLGFKRALVRINSRSILKDIPYQAIAAIDKIKKIGEDGVLAEMEAKGIELVKAKEYLTLIKTARPNEEISFILQYLKNYGFPADWFEFDPSIARSFSYSVGPIWEVEIPELGSSSVLGGERYDGLLEKLSGKDIGGTGFGLGFDRTLEAAEELGLVPQMILSAKVLVAVFNPSLGSLSQNAARLLRDAGIATEVFPDQKAKLEKQLKYANANNIPFVVIIGPEEAQKGVAQVKNMTTRESKTVKMEEIAKSLGTS
jgi:histidyl-tRNA synthetase